MEARGVWWARKDRTAYPLLPKKMLSDEAALALCQALSQGSSKTPWLFLGREAPKRGLEPDHGVALEFLTRYMDPSEMSKAIALSATFYCVAQDGLQISSIREVLEPRKVDLDGGK
eukprot:905432-Amphidinium_carterae.1